MNGERRREGPARKDVPARKPSGMLRQAGWWGYVMLIVAIFFIIGGVLSFLEGDIGVALQAIIVACLLAAGIILLARRRAA